MPFFILLLPIYAGRFSGWGCGELCRVPDHHWLILQRRCGVEKFSVDLPYGTKKRTAKPLRFGSPYQCLTLFAPPSFRPSFEQIAVTDTGGASRKRGTTI